MFKHSLLVVEFVLQILIPRINLQDLKNPRVLLEVLLVGGDVWRSEII
jgi:hypothetical protein